MNNRNLNRILVLLISIVIMMLRRPWSLFHPEFYFDDGDIFNAQRDSIIAFITPYRGYYHLLPRIIASITDSAFLYAWISFIGAVLVLVNVFSARINICEVQRYIMILAIALIVPFEVLFNVAYFQWFLAVALVTLLLKTKPQTVWHYIGDVLLILIAGLSSIFVFVLLPLLFVYRKDLLVVGSVTTIIQLSAIPSMPSFSGHVNILHYANITMQNTVGHLLGLKEYPRFVVILYVNIMSLLIYYGRKSQYVLMFIAAYFIFLVAAMPRIGESLNGGDRYYFLPNLMLLWSVTLLYPKIKESLFSNS